MRESDAPHALSASDVALFAPRVAGLERCVRYAVFVAVTSGIGLTDVRLAWDGDDECVGCDACRPSSACASDDVAAVAPLLFGPVSFKATYVRMDAVMLACAELDAEHLSLTAKWRFEVDDGFTSEAGNAFIAPNQLASTATTVEVTATLNGTAQAFTVRKRRGVLKAIISDGTRRYVPYDIDGEAVRIVLSADGHSFDQEQEAHADAAEWRYSWTYSMIDDDDDVLCPDVSESDPAQMQLSSHGLHRGAVYMLCLQLTADQRTDDTFVLVSVAEELNTVVEVNVHSDHTRYYLPSYHGHTAIVASIGQTSSNLVFGADHTHTPVDIRFASSPRCKMAFRANRLRAARKRSPFPFRRLTCGRTTTMLWMSMPPASTRGTWRSLEKPRRCCRSHRCRT